MNPGKIYSFKIKEGAYQEMRKILRFPGVTGPEIDGQICRVTVTTYSVDLSLKNEYLLQYSNDSVFQVRLLNNDEREFIVMGSMLQHLEEPIVTE